MRLRWDAPKGARLKFVSVLDQSKIKCTSSHSCLAEDGLLKLDKMGGCQGGVRGCREEEDGLWVRTLTSGFVTTTQEPGPTGTEDVRVIITSSTSHHQY